MSGLTKKNTDKIRRLTMLALFTAIIVIMGFTPLGFLKIGIVEITFIVIPVAIGAVLLGPTGGAILGGVFGIVSFIQCFGYSAFGVLCFNINPYLTFALCFFPRLLTGWLSGVIFSACDKLMPKLKLVSCSVACLSCALLNTITFVTGLVLFFGFNEVFLSQLGSLVQSEIKSVWDVVLVIVTLNAVLEAIVSFIAGAGISRALIHFLPAKKPKEI